MESLQKAEEQGTFLVVEIGRVNTYLIQSEKRHESATMSF